MKKFIAVLLIVVLILGLAACGKKDDTKKELVRVGDAVITFDDLNQYAELSAYIQGMDLTKIQDEATLKTIREMILEDMITLETVKEHYAGKEKEVLPETAEEDLATFLKESKDTKEVAAFLKERKISDETLTRYYMLSLYVSAYFEELEENMADMDAKVEAYYTEKKADFNVDEVTASHILVKEKELAQEIMDKLKAGESFEVLAAEHGTDATKDAGGSLGTFGRGAMIKDFEDAAFALQPGQLSDIVETEFGYHIIKVTDKKQGFKTLEEAAPEIKSILISGEAEKKFKELRDEIGVEYLTEEYPGKDALPVE